MDSDIAPVNRICDLARRYGAISYIDEVHSAGMYGPAGAGIAAREGASHRIDVVERRRRSAASAVSPRRAPTLVDAVRSYAPVFIFTTALPPAVAPLPQRRSGTSRPRNGSATAMRPASNSMPPACR